MTLHVSDHARRRFEQRFSSFDLQTELAAARPISYARLSKRTELDKQAGHTYRRSSNSGAVFAIANETLIVTVLRVGFGKEDLAEQRNGKHAERRKRAGGRRKPQPGYRSE